jgi:hypothetical protein
MSAEEARVVDADKVRVIEEQLTLCRQTLRCAALALCQAEDEGFEGDEGPAATRVVERCTDDLQQLEEQLSRLQMESNPCEVAS